MEVPSKCNSHTHNILWQLGVLLCNHHNLVFFVSFLFSGNVSFKDFEKAFRFSTFCLIRGLHLHGTEKTLRLFETTDLRIV